MFSQKSSVSENKLDHIEKLKEIYRLDEEKNLIGNCIEDAQNVVHIFTGKSIFFTKNDAFSFIPAEELFLKKDNICSHPIVQDLFSNKSEHVIFYVEHDWNRHVYAIEKEIYQGKTQYRIYQSWICKFTLLDWLEGRGKTSFTPAELKKFIQNVIHQIAEDQSPSGMLRFFCCRKNKKIESNIRMIKLEFNKESLEKNYNYAIKSPRKLYN